MNEDAPDARAAWRAVTIVRIATAALLSIHGVARAANGWVAPFGEALGGWGFPLGHALAWAITVYEIAAGPLLALGKGLPWVALGNLAILAGGIALVHARAGWFVVGGGRNGVEFSVLLIACLAAVIVAHRRRRKTAGPEADPVLSPPGIYDGTPRVPASTAHPLPPPSRGEGVHAFSYGCVECVMPSWKSTCVGCVDSWRYRPIFR